MPWDAQDASRHAPSLGTSWGIPGLGGDGPGVRMALAQRDFNEAFFFAWGIKLLLESAGNF